VVCTATVPLLPDNVTGYPITFSYLLTVSCSCVSAAMTVMDPKENAKVSTYNSQKAPPPFGHALHKFFAFDPAYVNLNHGSYGSLPLPVKAYVDQLENEAEANPDLWCRFTYYPRLTAVREQVAQLIGARADECVIVQNTSVGLNTVLREFEWREGDILIGGMVVHLMVL
jgi:selenocysteine lyase/cysteine desulfurase